MKKKAPLPRMMQANMTKKVFGIDSASGYCCKYPSIAGYPPIERAT